MEKPSALRQFKVLFESAGTMRWLIPLSCLLSVLSALAGLAPFVFIWMVIREIMLRGIEQSWHQVMSYGWLAFGFAVVSLCIYFGALTCSHLAAFRIERLLKMKVMAHMVTLPLAYFSSQTTGRLRKLLDDNVALTHVFTAHQLPDLAGSAITPIIGLVLMFTFDWRLGLACLVPLALSPLFFYRMTNHEMEGFLEKYLASLEEMNTAAVEYVRGIPVVKVFQQNVFSFKDFYQSIVSYRDQVLKYTLFCRGVFTSFQTLLQSATLVLVPLGAWMLMSETDGRILLLDLLLYMLFVPYCAIRLQRSLHVKQQALMALHALGRLEMLMHEESLPEPLSPQVPQGNELAFEGVIYQWPDTPEPAVNDVSFVIPEGQTWALVGSSGGGKTTLAGLIPRFYDVQKGRITLGSVDLRHMSSKDLMNRVAFLFQNGHLWKTSLYENILAGRPEASREEVLKAASQAQCDDIFVKFPEGIDTVVGSKGVWLSGGETQRILLARALLKNAPVAVLDEATAFADPENEHLIRKAFDVLAEDRTMLLIAHRLSSVVGADKILVMDQGRIIESGSHDELLKLGGRYANLWRQYEEALDWKAEERSEAR